MHAVLIIGKQWRPLSVLADNLSTLERIPANQSRNSDDKREDEKDARYGECEDPLERDCVRQKLPHAKCYIRSVPHAKKHIAAAVLVKT